MKEFDVAVKFWGSYGCYTRPEYKVERVSYPVITPAAARGALESIFWKPEFRWEIREIWVTNPIKEFAVVRNEIDSRQSAEMDCLYIEEKRQQRTSVMIKNPAYVVFADIRLKTSTQHPKRKYLEQFNRYLTRGSCHHQPYLGTRECTCCFGQPTGSDRPINTSMAIGNMLFDIAYCPDSKRKDLSFYRHMDGQAQIMEGYTKPLFFDARMEAGIIKVSWSLYEELYRREGVDVKGVG